MRLGGLAVALTLAMALLASVVRPVAFAGRTEMAVLGVWLWAGARAAESDRLARQAMIAGILVATVSSLFVLTQRRAEPTGPQAIAILAHSVRPGDRVFAGPGLYLPARLASDRGQIAVPIDSMPSELARHPGWFAPAPPRDEDYRELETALARLPSESRVWILMHPLSYSTRLAAILAVAGSPRVIVSGPDALLIEWSPGRRPSGLASRASPSSLPSAPLCDDYGRPRLSATNGGVRDFVRLLRMSPRSPVQRSGANPSYRAGRRLSGSESAVLIIV